MIRRAWLVGVGICLLAGIACDGEADAPTPDGGGRDARTGSDATPPGDAPGVDVPPGIDSGMPPDTRRRGMVRLVGRELHDDGGPFVALGASLFWAAWGYKFDRPRLERNLQWLADHGFHYIRALGVVGDPAGPDSWDGREIDWRWEDYDAVIAGVTDLAWDTYGLRVEWAFIGDGQVSIPEEADRYALVDRFLAMAASRAEKIIHFEIANEAWQNGFDGDSGNTQLRELSQYLKDRTEIIVAASAPSDRSCAGVTYVYGAPGEVADLVTEHFDRDLGRPEGNWGPVWMPWTFQDCGPYVGSNNEPIGPGSSVAKEADPTRLAASALSTWISGLPFHVFHSRAGVRGFDEVMDMGGADAFQHVRELVAGDVSGWDRRDGTEADAPLRFFVEDGSGTMHPDAYWMDVPDARRGVVRALGAMRGSEFVVLPLGILDSVTFEARREVAFDVFDPVTGEMVGSEILDVGDRATLPGRGGALLLRGRFR
jgi:hypothetical protein